eukprot:scaffold5782_cov618-Prasinococcus_capsulatus_cf.AAC.9
MTGIEWKKLRGIVRALHCSCHVKTPSFLAKNFSFFGLTEQSSLHPSDSSRFTHFLNSLDENVQRGPLCLFVLQERKNEEALLDILMKHKKCLFLGRGNLHPFLFSSSASKMSGKIDQEVSELEALLSPSIPFSHLLASSSDVLSPFEHQFQDLSLTLQKIHAAGRERKEKD